MKTPHSTDAEGSPLLLRPNNNNDSDVNNGIPQMSQFRLHKESGITWRRVMAIVLQIVPSLPLAGWILLSSDPSPFDLPEGNVLRRRLVFSWFLVVLLAYEGKLAYIERQFMFMELFFVLPFLFPAMIVCISVYARMNEAPIGSLDYLAGVLVLSGTFLNTWPEIQRMRWKKQAGHQGRLYTQGWFSYVRNVNYLGDCLWATGWAMASSFEYMLWVPLVIVAVFVFMYIPEKESYLAKRYANEWLAYEARTVKLFPFVY